MGGGGNNLSSLFELNKVCAESLASDFAQQL